MSQQTFFKDQFRSLLKLVRHHIVKAGKASFVLKILLEAASMRSISERMVTINLNQSYDQLINVKRFKERMKDRKKLLKLLKAMLKRDKF
uniref:Transposase n=1 Tax=Strongyloides papillosus TaxID=174720 RepID=A0A0N5BH00_STREA